METTKDLTYVVSVRVRITDLAIIGKFLQDTGLYRSARPSGALAYALQLFSKIIVGNDLAKEPADLQEAIAIIGLLRYSTEQLEKQLTTQFGIADRASLEAESIELFGVSARTLVDLRKQVRSMSDSEKEQLTRGIERSIAERTPGFNEEEFAALEKERLRKEAENMAAMAQQSGQVAEEG